MSALISTLLAPSRKPGWISQASSPWNDADTLSTGADAVPELHAEGGERPQLFPWRMAEGVGKLDGFVVADPVPGEDHVALAGEIGAEFGD